MSFFQVPFIAFYRKEYVEPELNINDLWKVWHYDEKVSVFGWGGGEYILDIKVYDPSSDISGNWSQNSDPWLPWQSDKIEAFANETISKWFFSLVLYLQWTQLVTRKKNLMRLFEKMQNYQFEENSDPEKLLESSVRPLTDDDIDR